MGMSSSTCLRSPPNSEVTRPNQFACMPSSRASVGQDRRGPLDGVDAGEQRGVDEAGGLEERLVVPVGVAPRRACRRWRCARARTACAASPARPTSSARTPIARCRSRGRAAASPSSVDGHPAADVRAQRVLGLPVAAVDLRAVPPVRDLVEEGHRQLPVGGRRRGGSGRRSDRRTSRWSMPCSRSGSSSASGMRSISPSRLVPWLIQSWF